MACENVFDTHTQEANLKKKYLLKNPSTYFGPTRTIYRILQFIRKTVYFPEKMRNMFLVKELRYLKDSDTKKRFKVKRHLRVQSKIAIKVNIKFEISNILDSD